MLVCLYSYRVRKKLQDGRIKMDAGALPTFLWTGNPPGRNFNEDDMLSGLFRGDLLLRVHSELAISVCF